MSGKNKMDMNALGQFIMALPDPARIIISNTANWLYESDVHDDMDEHNTDTFGAGDQHEEDAQEQEQFVPPQQDIAYTAVRSLSMTPGQWSWIQTKIGDLRAEQARQGIKQACQGTIMDEMHALMQ